MLKLWSQLQFYEENLKLSSISGFFLWEKDGHFPKAACEGALPLLPFPWDSVLLPPANHLLCQLGHLSLGEPH